MLSWGFTSVFSQIPHGRGLKAARIDSSGLNTFRYGPKCLVTDAHAVLGTKKKKKALVAPGPMHAPKRASGLCDVLPGRQPNRISAHTPTHSTFSGCPLICPDGFLSDRRQNFATRLFVFFLYGRFVLPPSFHSHSAVSPDSPSQKPLSPLARQHMLRQTREVAI